MVAKIPKSIKTKVLNEWLQGIRRNKIAENNGIGAGTVTDILRQARNNDIPDIDLMRDLALKLKKEGLDVNQFASSVRLKKVLDRIGLPEEKLESLLEEIDIYSFKRGMEEKEFVSKIDEILQMAYEFDIPISDVLVKISQTQHNP
jgi:transcriptional regulator with XRE-family HTH domain